MRKSELVKIVRAVIKQEMKPIKEDMERKFLSLIVEALAEEKANLKIMSKKTAAKKKMVVEEDEPDMLGDMLPKSRKVTSTLPRTKPIREQLEMGQPDDPYGAFSENTAVTVDTLIKTAVDEESLVEQRAAREIHTMERTAPQVLEEVEETDILGLENVNYSAFIGDEKSSEELSEENSIEEERRKIVEKIGKPQIQVMR